MSQIPLNLTQSYADALTALRRDLHRQPELGFTEVKTAARIAAELRALGCEVTEGIGKTGVVGVLTEGDGPRIGLRADMDALPIEEQSTLQWRSEVPGIFHGCGHDGHMAMLVGAARALAESRAFRGTAVFIFQPAEEGLGGSRAMLADGLFDRFPCDEIYALHNAPHHPQGTVAVSPGPAMAGADFFDVTLRGRGGHGALPQTTRDPVVALGALVQAVQGIVGRNVDPLRSGVVSITRVRGGDAYNVIPSEVTLGGTIRALDDDTRALMRARLRKICDGIALAHEVEADVDIRDIFSVLDNHAEQARAVIACATDLLGAQAVDAKCPPFMASEDFADMLHQVPGAYFWLGIADGPGLHHPAYVFDDSVLPLGAALLARLVEARSSCLVT
ncbi:M20 aminoacylase family protein [Pseudotabrizicola alkalilacus]|uniref:Amidohydrolase n=1 Tax=Pseudotabrizicola alkalilacus TaxID=2305252 RepID=A0A411YWG1_9RHOB|nr:M20 aminoacylase family protein [Pseudotabrizicola alkalilacus]RGP35186.1 amidohydrolase [Pseudotabrizicola alkalilacus]